MITKESYLKKILVSKKRKKIDTKAIKLYMEFVNFCKHNNTKYFEIDRHSMEKIASCSGVVARNKLKVLEQAGLILIRSVGLSFNSPNKWSYEIEILNIPIFDDPSYNPLTKQQRI